MFELQNSVQPRHRIKEKMGVETLAELTLLASRQGLIEVHEN